MINIGNMEVSNLEHINPEEVIALLLIHSASPHGRRLMEKLLTEDPYNVSVSPDKETINLNAQIAHVYLKAMGIRMVFKKSLIQMIVPAYIIPALNRKPDTFRNENGYIIPAYTLTEKEMELLGGLLRPGYIDSGIRPGFIVPGQIIPRPNKFY